MDATTKLPHTWILWYHDPNNSDYSLESYIRIAAITNVDEFWSLVDTIQKDAWESGMFFFMREGFRPLWDAPENERGGAWSKKVDAHDTHAVYIDCMVHCIAGSFLTRNNETLVGVTVSPKGQFHIIKIWNTTTAVCDRRLLSPTLRMRLGDDVAYKAHNLRPK
jgi:hypothetical protein